MQVVTRRQKVFIEHYLQTWNASEAARRAGYTGDAKVIGSRLLTYVHVKDAITQRMKETAMKTDEVLSRLADVARVNMGDFVEVHDKVEELPVNPVDPSAGTMMVHFQEFEINWDAVKNRGHMIKKLTMTRAGPVIELHDGLAALVKIGEAERLFVQRTSLENPDGSPMSQKADTVIYIPDNGRPRQA